MSALLSLVLASAVSTVGTVPNETLHGPAVVNVVPSKVVVVPVVPSQVVVVSPSVVVEGSV